ncbi:sulfurtransferase [Haloferula rosea]|uniref:tRNA uridine(34) hydroxylase n=1 Tax=Haloferula rosea TaxID=490093 RepID=A0A934R808_9BACT|nr:sulfurtransferase [Haloferula rosea]MBK1825982.1 sulfurtransferase [Haloferula rosea]
MSQITNISAYHFTALTGLKEMRQRLLDFCKANDLKGTILLAPEGINLFVAGKHLAIEELVFELRKMPGLGNLHPKYSQSAEQPFNRMLVRLKKEIIAFGVDGIDPGVHTAPRLSAAELKQWLDEGKPVVLYDTRNDYEVKLGTFKGALPAGINHFRDFPEAVGRLPDEMKDAPVVTFCTGGIRCEKAAPFMERMGFRNVYQLEGGILKYFEEVGSDHYEGECFVFDQRVGVDPALRESGSVVCFACQTPLTAEEADDPRYVVGESCPYCFRSDESKRAERIAARQARIEAAADPLPGSMPYDNRKPIRIPGAQDGLTLIDALDGMFPHFGRDKWLKRLENHRIVGPEDEVVGADRIVRGGEQYVRLLPGMVEPDVSAGIRVIDEDEALIVLDKPAPLPMHPCGRFNRNTLEYLLRMASHPEVPRPVHRLDANTSGVVVCAKTRHFGRIVHPQFENGEVEKCYLARVHGAPDEDEFTLDAPISTEPTELGAREIDEVNGVPARTEVEVVKRCEDGTTLLFVRPLTGRTHQIRIHLWAAGWPIVGDPVYLQDQRRGEIQTLTPREPKMCLHAWTIALRHPICGEKVSYSAPAPGWFDVELPSAKG